VVGRSVVGLLLLGGVAKGGTHSNPAWASYVIDAILLLVGAWLLVSALLGMRHLLGERAMHVEGGRSAKAREASNVRDQNK